MAAEATHTVEWRIITNIEEVSKNLKKVASQFEGTDRAQKKNKKSNESLTSAMSRYSKSLRETSRYQERSNKLTEKGAGAMKGLAGEIMDVLRQMNARAWGALGITVGIGALIDKATDLVFYMSNLRDELNFMSDDFGNTSQAVNVLFGAFGKSLSGLDDLKSSMKSLADQGLRATDTGMIDLVATVGNLNRVTGVSLDSWANLLGAFKFKYDGTIGQMNSLSNAMIATGLNGTRLEKVVQDTTDIIGKFADFSANAESQSQALAESVGKTAKVFDELGISADKATEFMNNVLDPEKFQQNQQLFARLGVSTQEYFDALESADGAELFTDKILGALPQVAKELQSMPDPLARYNLAKDLGIDIQMAGRLANATRGEIQDLVAEYKGGLEQDRALKQKQEQAKAAQAKFDDALTMLKIQALTPLMNMISGFIGGPMFPLLSSLAKSFSTILGAIVRRLQPGVMRMANAFAGFVDKFGPLLEKGNWGEITEYLVKGIGSGLTMLLTELKPVMWDMITGAAKGFVEIFKESPIIGTLIALFAGKALLGPIGGLIDALQFFTSGKLTKMLTRGLFGGRAGLGTSATKGLFGNIIPGARNLIGGAGRSASGGLANNASSLVGTTRSVGRGRGVIGGIANIGKSAIGRVGGIAGTLRQVGVGGLMRGAAKSAAGVGAKAVGGIGLKSIPMIGQIMGAVIGGIEGMTKAADYFGKSSDEAITTSERGAAALAGAVTLGLGPLIDDLFGTRITAALANMFKDIIDWIDPVYTKFKGLFWIIMPGLTALIETFKYVNDNWESIAAKGRIIWIKVKSFFEEIAIFYSDAVDDFMGYINKITSVVSNAISWVDDKLGGAITSVGNALDWVDDKLGGAITSVGNALDRVYDLFMQWGGDLVKSAMSFFVDDSEEQILGIAENRVKQLQTGEINTAIDELQKLEEQIRRQGPLGENEEGSAALLQDKLNQLNITGIDRGLIKEAEIDDTINIIQDVLRVQKRENERKAEEAKRQSERLNTQVSGIAGNVQKIADKDNEARPTEVNLNAFTAIDFATFKYW